MRHQSAGARFLRRMENTKTPEHVFCVGWRASNSKEPPKRSPCYLINVAKRSPRTARLRKRMPQPMHFPTAQTMKSALFASLTKAPLAVPKTKKNNKYVGIVQFVNNHSKTTYPEYSFSIVPDVRKRNFVTSKHTVWHTRNRTLK